MVQYFDGNDLYNDLFMNNNREMYIKILLIDQNEPEIKEFYIRDTDVNVGTSTVSNIIVPYSSNIYNSDYISSNAIDIDTFQGNSFSIGSTFLNAGLTYMYLSMNNLNIKYMNTYYTEVKTNILGTGYSGKYYKANKYNKLIVSNKEIQGSITSGSLRTDGNSPMRRVIDFSCVVDKSFGTNSDLKLHDFDNKKIKILIGIKDSVLSTYDYSKYFYYNGTQRDSNNIVWFKLGVFIPRNVSIKHSTDSYLISVTAQDKMSSLDGSFGGVIGAGVNYKDPATGNNTNFYDTITSAFSSFTKEPSSKVNVKFADDYSIFKYPPDSTYTLPFITAGSSIMKVKDIKNIDIGMEIEAPGVYKGTKVFLTSPGKNLFNSATRKIGYYISPYNGTEYVNVNYDTSDYIEVKAGVQYAISTARLLAVFDSDKVIVPSQAQNINPAAKTTLIPNQDGFIKVSFRVEDISTSQVEIGSTQTSYESYTTVPSVYMDYIAYDTIGSTQSIYTNGAKVLLGATFKNPSYKNYFATSVLESNTPLDGSSIFIKPVNINFKNSTYSYPVYTTISAWSPTTWGSELIDLRKPIYGNAASGSTILIYKQDLSTGMFYSQNLLKVGDVLYSGSSTGLLTGLTTYSFYRVSSVAPSIYGFSLSDLYGNPILPSGATTGASLVINKFDSAYQYDLTINKDTNCIRYNQKDNKYYIARKTYYGSGGFKYRWEIARYNSNSGYTFGDVNMLFNFYSPDEKSISKICFNKIGKLNDIYDTYFVLDNTRKIITSQYFDTSTSTNLYPRGIQSIVGQRTSDNSFIVYNNIIGQVDTEIFIGDLTSIDGSLSIDGKNLTPNTKYIISSKGSTNMTLKRADNGEVVIINSTKDSSGSNYYDSYIPYYFSSFNANIFTFTDPINDMECGNDNSLFLCYSSSNITKHAFDINTGVIDYNGVATIGDYSTQNCRSITFDSKGNFYVISDYLKAILKIDSVSMKIINKIYLSDFWSNNYFNIGSATSYPYINTISIDGQDNLSIITDGKYIDSYGSSKTLSNNIIFCDSDTFIPYAGLDFYDINSTYDNAIIGNNNMFFYVRDKLTTKSLVQFPLVSPYNITQINALVDFSPQPSNTIVKSSSDKVTSILEDVKSQLDSYQYYYDHDGDFYFKEDKRLSFFDPTFDKVNPYDFNFENYNLNVAEVPFSFNFNVNKNLIADFSSNVDLSNFKNDFFVYGTKKGLDLSIDNTNITMLYHLTIDDIGMKNIPATYAHPWQQYIIDQGNAGTTYSNFIYYKELKENFEFKNSRLYNPDETTAYVTGEFITVNNSYYGVSGSAVYNLYEVVAGGIPTKGVYPYKTDGNTIEYLNSFLGVNGLAVKFYGKLMGSEHEKNQGIYSKIFSEQLDKKVALVPGNYFTNTSTSNQKTYVYKIESLIFKDSTGTVLDYASDTPISINLYQFRNTKLAIAKNGTGGDPISITFYSTDQNVELGGAYSCTMTISNIEQIYGFEGVFRKDNSGVYATDFVYKTDNGTPGKEGIPTSWIYYYDIINIAANPTKATQSNVGITYWQSGVYYEPNSLVYSDDKIYRAMLGGTSSIAPSGFGDDYNSFVDSSGLTWKLNQIAVDLNKMKVSTLGSRKSSVFDKDINVLFAPKDSLAYFYTSGYYFFILSDYLQYETYSSDFHNRLENLIRQFSVLYPSIKLIFVPQSQINDLFVINKSTILKGALSVIKKNIYLNFVNGQNVSIGTIPIYNLEPLTVIKLSDENSDIFGNFIITDYSLPLSNEGFMNLNCAKTHPYNDLLDTLPQITTSSEPYSNSNLNGNTVFG